MRFSQQFKKYFNVWKIKSSNFEPTYFIVIFDFFDFNKNLNET